MLVMVEKRSNAADNGGGCGDGGGAVHEFEGNNVDDNNENSSTARPLVMPSPRLEKGGECLLIFVMRQFN